MTIAQLLEELTPRMAINDGGDFILSHWDWKYANVRIDMRTGMCYCEPGYRLKGPPPAFGGPVR